MQNLEQLYILTDNANTHLQCILSSLSARLFLETFLYVGVKILQREELAQN